MEKIVDKKKELQTNLISSFLILLSICLFIALLINLRFGEDCATVIVGMLGVCAALFAPTAAYYFYDAWKDQKQYELEKEIFEIMLDNLALSYYEMTQINTRIIRISKLLSDNLVVCKNINEIVTTYNPSRFILIYAQLDKYGVIKNDLSLLILFREYENSYLLLKRLNHSLLKAYNSYFEKINKDDIYNSSHDFSSRKYLTDYERNIYSLEINLFNSIFNHKNKTTFFGDRTGILNIESSMCYEEADKNLRKLYDDMVKLVTNEMKP